MNCNELRKEFRRRSFRAKLKNELGNTCVNCNSNKNIEYHHIVPLVNGGTNNISNIVALCEICHYKAHDKESFKAKNGGRPQVISYEEAEPTLHRYFNLEIGMKEAKKLLNISPKTKSTWYRLTKEYKEKYKIKKFRNNLDVVRANGNLIEGKLIGCTVLENGKKIEYKY